MEWERVANEKPRLSNSYENRMVVDSATTTPMDTADPSGGGDNHAYPSPWNANPRPRQYREQMAPIRINGVGENAPILLHCEWNPKDPSSLAAAGTDALARVWTITRATTGALPNGDSSNPSGHVTTVNQPFHSLVDDETPPNTNVTALAWNWDGTAIAVATEHGKKARINIWGPDGSHLQRFEVAQTPVIKLRWNPSATALLAISVDTGGSIITKPESKSKCFLTMDSPIVALSFTPDGAFIAGATSSKVLIWKVGDHAIPRASWSRTPHPGWLSPKVNAETDEEDPHCLCWDATGTKLAYGANSRDLLRDALPPDLNHHDQLVTTGDELPRSPCRAQHNQPTLQDLGDSPVLRPVPTVSDTSAPDYHGGNGLPDEEEFAKLVEHWDPANADVAIQDPSDWNRNGEYGDIVGAVTEAIKGADVRVYRVSKDATRVEYFVVGCEGSGKSARLVGVRALSVES
ncbi:unnamed protein product [Parascedosporium putredinis]|uniref:WD40 repeat-like protein n=1 Tax=Parascedosporium putredinis TaxID=1442378 RepID=A0A9P1MDH7_9PEZI|nr:unnamed protein product [Parascedosporium putredinis]CAI7999671.1 unnamed protein product [Parascedosporium putredinis]